MGRSQLNLAHVGNEPASAILRDHHGKVIGFRRERHDSAQWNRDGGMRNFTQTDRRDHAWPQMTVAISYGHFNGKDSISCVSSWRDASDTPLHRNGVILCLDRQFLP